MLVGSLNNSLAVDVAPVVASCTVLRCSGGVTQRERGERLEAILTTVLMFYVCSGLYIYLPPPPPPVNKLDHLSRQQSRPAPPLPPRQQTESR